MGYGDEIMALGRAETIYSILGKPVAICDTNGIPRKHCIWENHPAVDSDSPLHIIDGPSVRPYILKWKRSNAGLTIVWNTKYRAHAGHIRLTAREQVEALDIMPKKPFAIIEPIVRRGSSQNKKWDIERWEEVIKNFPIPVYQFNLGEQTKILCGAFLINSYGFRISAGIVEHASLVMTVEGGMHHMAASMNTPAVVVFGGFADPKITGYIYQKNFYVELPESPCGKYYPCKHCKKAMSMIYPDKVRKAALKILNKERSDETGYLRRSNKNYRY